jgi:hypothetical protein
MVDLAFVLLNEPVNPEPTAVVREAAALGLALTYAPSKEGDADGPVGFDMPGGAHLFVMMIAAPHPDATKMASGPLSPKPEVLAGARAHAIVTIIGLSGEQEERDRILAISTGAVVRATGAVAAMLGFGVLFYVGAMFADFAALAAEQGQLPMEIAVDITAARESEKRMSFLTHGMTRYGREELYVTCPISGKGALDFVLSTARWLYMDRQKHLPTGDTLGRTAQEKIRVQRVPNPTGNGPLVIRLDLEA